MKTRSLLPLAFAAIGLLSACSTAKPEVSQEYVLGTRCAISLYDPHGKDLFPKLFARLREIEAHMSANRDDSEIAAVNRAAGQTAVKVSADTFFVTKRALFYAEKTGGAFDPTVGPLVKLWGIGTDAARVPSPAEIKAVLAKIDYRQVGLNESTLEIKLGRAGMALDLGAIAKGYAADELVKILRAAGQKRAIVDLGGNIYALGAKKAGPKPMPWAVGVQDPKEARGGYLGVASVTNTSLVTSGVYERFFEKDGKRYHHILDTKTGYPVDNGLLSDTIISASSIDADGLSTSVFALGPERGLALAQSIDPTVGVIFVDSQEKITMNDSAKKVFKPMAAQ
jgi:thiamine biosynthesis lipoprotein